MARLSAIQSNRGISKPVRRTFLQMLVAWDTGFKTRLALSKLDPHLRRDIGLPDRGEIWDAPPSFTQPWH